MKKILALALAAVMALGTTTVAFAGAPTTIAAPLFNKAEAVAGSNMATITKTDFFVKDSNGLLTQISNPTDAVEQGTTIYLPLMYEGTVAITGTGEVAVNPTNRAPMTANEMKKYKIKADLEVGKDLFTDIKIEYVKFDLVTDAYAYAAAFYTDKESTTKIEDLAGKLTIYRTSVKNPNAKPSPLDNMNGVGMVSFNYSDYGYTAQNLATISYTVQSKDDPAYSPVVSFSGLDEVTIVYDGVGEQEVNVEDQGKLFLGFSREYIDSIGDAHPEVNMEFINFLGKPKFNKWGKMYFYANEGDVLYQDVNGELVLVDTTWDEDYEALVFRARELGTFVIADGEIDTATTTTTEEPKDNPDTGR